MHLLLVVFAVFGLSGVLGRSSLSHQKPWNYPQGQGYRQGHTQLRGGYGYPDKRNYGGDHSGYGRNRYQTREGYDEKQSLAQDLGIHTVHFEHKGLFYMSEIYNSSTEVKPEDSNKMEHAFESSYLMYIKGQFSGYNWTNYARDRMVVWNAGGEVAVHMIYPDGHHERVLLGDVKHNHNAHYMVVIPPGVWKASELLEGDYDYSLVTVAHAPGIDFSLYKHYDIEEFASQFPQYDNMIRRLDKIRDHDHFLGGHGYANHRRYEGVQSHSGYGQSGHHLSSRGRHELKTLAQELGIHPMEFPHYGTYYMSRAINASTEVKPEGSNDMVKAFTAAYSMAIKGHLSGYEWTNYPRDRVAIWNAGGSLAIHLLYPDGHHERVVLGDARHNHDAQYKVVVPPGVWEASELLEGDYVLMTIGVAPELDMSLFKTYDVERVVSDFPQYEQLIRRLDKIREHDVAMDFSHTSYDQELRHGESGRPHYGGYRSQDGHRPSGHHEYDNDRRSHHDNLRSQNSYDRQHDNYGNQYDNYGHQYDNYGRQYDNNRRQYDNSGRRHGGNGHSDDEIRSLAHELGIHRVSYEDKGIFYMSETNYSTTDVKPEGSDNLVPSFESTYVMYIKGQFSGYNWTNYQRDRVAVWNAGGIIALHLLHPDGRHERVLLGDVKHNHNVQYRVVVPHGVWEASEIIEGDYALITFVAAPALDHSLFKPYSVDEVAHEFPAYENMIRRLDRIGSHDVPYDFSQKSHGYPDHRRYGGDHSQGRYGQDGHLSSRGRHELRSLAQELGIHPVGIANYGTFYHSAFYNSSTEVMPEGDSKMVHAFTSSYAMFIQGHFSGYQWNNYPRDRVNIWNAGGSVALHMLHPDGHHERVILGDVEHNHEAQYRVVIPAGVWVASELIEGDYVLVTYVAAPAMDLSLFQNYNVEDVVSEFSQYENMIRRLDNIREHDVLLDMSQTSHDEYGQSGHRYEYDDNSRYNQDNQRSHHQGGYSYGGYGRGQSSHPDQYNDNHRYNQYNQRSHNQGRYSYGGYGHTQSSHRDEYDYNHKYNQYNQRAHNQGRYSYGGYGRGQSSHPDQYDDNHRYNQYNQRSHNQGGDRYGGFGRGQSSHPEQYNDNHRYNQYNQRSHNANHYDNRNDNRFDNRYDNRYDNHYDNQFDNRYDNRYDNHYYNRRSNHQ